MEKRVLRQNYEKLLNSGMFWEFHPELSGEWEKDREVWEAMENKRNQKIDLPEDLNAFPLNPDECRLPIESTKNRFFQEVSDYLNAKYGGGIHYDSERSLFEVYDHHEKKSKIEDELDQLFKHKLRYIKYTEMILKDI